MPLDIDLGRSGGYIQSLGAQVHDAVTIVAGSEHGIRALQGLTMTILRRPIAGIDEIYAELDRFDRTSERYGAGTLDVWRAAGGPGTSAGVLCRGLLWRRFWRESRGLMRDHASEGVRTSTLRRSGW